MQRCMLQTESCGIPCTLKLKDKRHGPLSLLTHTFTFLHSLHLLLFCSFLLLSLHAKCSMWVGYRQLHFLLQGHGTRTLGKRLLLGNQTLHYTDKNHLKHYGREVINYDYNSSYALTYKGPPSTEYPELRRFPRVHSQQTNGTGDGGGGKVSGTPTSTTNWFTSETPFNTHLKVLATSQQPFLKHNNWKYSNHKMQRCYPPYNTQIPTDGPKTLQTWMLNDTTPVHNQDPAKSVACWLC